MSAKTNPYRKPHVVPASDLSVEIIAEVDAEHSGSHDQSINVDVSPAGTVQPGLTHLPVKQGIKWGTILLSAMAGLAVLALSLSFTSFIAQVVQRDDWIGWVGFGLAVAAGVALAVLSLRELAGLLRLSKLQRLKSSIAKVLRDQDLDEERAIVQRIKKHFSHRDDLKWGLARLNEHQQDVHDPGALLRLTDREIMTPLDQKARALILKSAKRVTVLTAISPLLWVALIYVLAENLRLIRAIAGLYGARPGGVGAIKLGRMVFTHIVATGGLAMTDDLIGQFLGQDLVRRLSRRLGEGVFNGALTARIGTAAVGVIRPVPYLDAKPLRLRDIVGELLRKDDAIKQANAST